MCRWFGSRCFSQLKDGPGIDLLTRSVEVNVVSFPERLASEPLQPCKRLFRSRSSWVPRVVPGVQVSLFSLFGFENEWRVTHATIFMVKDGGR